MTATTAADRHAPDWAAIIAVILGVTGFAVAQGLTFPLISLMLEGRHVPSLLIGLNAASFSAGLALATLSLHWLTRIAQGDRLIVFALLGCALALAAFSATSWLVVWFIARLALGFFAGLVFILSEAWLHTAVPNAIRGRIAGVYGAGMSLGFAAGPLAIPLFGSSHGFAFATTAVYLAAVAFLAAVLTRRTRTRPAAVPPGALMRVVRRTPVLILMVFAFGFADIASISGMPVYFVRTGRSEAFAALSVSAMAVPTAVAQAFIGALLDRFPKRLVAIGTGVVAGTSFTLIPLIEPEWAILVVFATMGAATYALYTCAFTLLGECYQGGLLVAGTAMFSLSYAGGSAAGSSATGLIMQVLSPSAAPVFVGLMLLLFTACFPAHRVRNG